jgi:hypothetical protein
MFAQTIVDLADCHTTLYHMVDPRPAEEPLPIGSRESYENLYQRLSRQRKLDYAEASTSRIGTILRRVEPAYSEDKFWHRYLGSDNYESYPSLAWDSFLPIQASLSARVECLTHPDLGCKVSPIPRVLLFPFGWSTWISMLITGDHTLSSLSSFIQSLFRDPVFSVSDSPSSFSLGRLFSHVAEGIRADAFGGPRTADSSTPDILAVVTVLAKRHGALSWRGFSPDEQRVVRLIVRPTGPPRTDPFDSQVCELDRENGELNFVVTDAFARFIWSQRLLRSHGRNARHLRCYHNNSFRSFVLAWHQLALLDTVLAQRPRLPPALRQLVQSAVFKLSRPPYRSASLLSFLGTPAIDRTLEAAGRLLEQA